MNDMKVSIEISPSTPAKYPANRFLPQDSEVMRLFKNQLELLAVNVKKPSGEDCFVTMDCFRSLWPHILKCLANLPDSSDVMLIYFSGVLLEIGLLSVFPYLSYGNDSNCRFYIPELCKDTESKSPISGRLCFEFKFENFEKLSSPSGFGFFPDTSVLGIMLAESRVKDCIRKNVFEKETLEFVLEDVFCWWLCDSDLAGMTIWHKSLDARKILQELRGEVFSKFDCPVIERYTKD